MAISLFLPSVLTARAQRAGLGSEPRADVNVRELLLCHVHFRAH
jgi:hypothetical protein